MAGTTLDIRMDDALEVRLRAAAGAVGRTPDGFVRQAVLASIDTVEKGAGPSGEAGGAARPGQAAADERPPLPAFAPSEGVRSASREAITAAARLPETACLPRLLAEARLPAPLADKAAALARRLVTALRAWPDHGGGVEGLLQEFSLSSQEGVALMCLAEALLRIPDRATRDSLIRDKISRGDWRAHLGRSPSVFVNAATWGLMLTGKLTATRSEKSLSAALTRMIGRGGEPLIRKGVDIAMRLLGEKFVCGETIAQALAHSRRREEQGFRYSFDMLGEAATTADDARRYLAQYEQAIHAIGQVAAGRGVHEGPGISIKLSALHPRYSRAQLGRVRHELMPRLRELAVLARSYDIGLHIDAEESERTELSLELLEDLCFEPRLAGWDGIGFVVQAYQKRAPFVIDHLVELAARSGHRLMVRLVKGAYWDSEIKRAQLDGLEDYPVFTRKVHTDVSYLACARRLLAAPTAIYPQFATHNAHTLAAVLMLAGDKASPRQFEFQCLHGMGEDLYEEVAAVLGEAGRQRACRIYAPVGSHETLLPYLVRRLLENGANTSFVHLMADTGVEVDRLVEDPVSLAGRIDPPGEPHPRIPLPADLFLGEATDRRCNSAGLDLSNEHRLASVAAALRASAGRIWRAAPSSVSGVAAADRPEPACLAVCNPADRRDVVGHVLEARAADVQQAVSEAALAAPGWAATPVAERLGCLLRAADTVQAQMQDLLGLLVREAGKTVPNAMAEVRETVDFLRYYARQAELQLSGESCRPLGLVACISPWNFPLAIFTGQVAAALVAGNAVLAKPAEQTPLIAARMVGILHASGIPASVLGLLPGRGELVGAALVADPRVSGVMFTGSIEVAKLIARSLARRLDERGHVVPLVAETGGQNAMVVDSSALAEQVVADVLSSAFDSAGQRCSALRLLCLQEDIAGPTLEMLRGAMRELSVGHPLQLATDVGPLIDAEARDAVSRHLDALRAAGHRVDQGLLPAACAHGSFVAPALVEIDAIETLSREVFGPVLHVLRYRREDLDTLVDRINAAGYGLTFGIHSRIDETIERVVSRIQAGNICINRNIVGAVVGVQPFGGTGLSGTGPKAGGPLYLRGLTAASPSASFDLGEAVVLPGPTGERNVYSVGPRGTVLCVPATLQGARAQWAALQATGNRPLWADGEAARALLAELEPAQRAAHPLVPLELAESARIDAVLFEGEADELRRLNQRIAGRAGPILPVQGFSRAELATGEGHYALERLLTECSISTNTAAAGGNASLMSIG